MKQYITFLFCLFSFISFSQDKKVHLVHGLGGDSFSWNDFNGELQSKCPGLETTTFHIASTAGIDAYSNALIDSLELDPNADDVAIGHSFGGINLRNIDSQNLFGAYITVGSVHEGSPLANAKENGQFQSWINNMCQEVIAEPIAAILNVNPFINLVAPFTSQDENLFCSNVYQLLLIGADKFLGDGQSVLDLKADGDGIVAGLPSASIPGIGVVCSTEGHPLWNLIDDGYNINSGEIAHEVEVRTMALSKFYSITANLTFNPWKKRRLRKAAKECRESSLFLKTTEAAWNELIGAGGDVINTSTIYQENWVCDCYDISTGNPIPCSTFGADIELLPLDIDPDSTCQSNSDCWQGETITIIEYGPDKPSDGLIPVDRQSLPGSIKEEYVANVSHFAEPSDKGVWNVLLKNINQFTAYHSSFIINNCI